jgi:hypothetical protein
MGSENITAEHKLHKKEKGKSDAEGIYLSILRMAAHGVPPEGGGVPSLRQFRDGTDKAGL